MSEAGCKMKRHILIVDDNHIDVRKVQAIVEHDELVPLIAKDGPTALEMSRSHRIDMAIVDLQMPQMNGFKLTEQFRLSSETKTLPILIMSGTYRAEEDVKTALKAGANDFILKPIDPMMLSSKMSRILTKQVSWGEWSLTNTEIPTAGAVMVKIEVLSISEMGLRIFSSVPLALKSSPQVEIPLLQELEIPTPFLEVLECTKAADGYTSYLSFIGLPETHLKKIRIFCQKLAAKGMT